VQSVISSAQMRQVDRLTTERAGISSLTLMENAAIATARCVAEFLGGDSAGKSILVFCGKGNNGGDGAAAARLLATAGARVDVILIGTVNNTRGDARENFNRLQRWKDEQTAREKMTPGSPTPGTLNLFECDSDSGWHQLLDGVLGYHDAVVDALFGTGLERPLETIHSEVVRFINRLRETRDTPPHTRTPIISIDLPSGLNADSAQPIGDAVWADATVTMTTPKRANVVPPAADHNGRLIVADIGSPVELVTSMPSDLFVTEADDARRWLIQTRYTPGSYKNTHGHALIIAGSRGFTGAAGLCGNAAMRAGAGLVTVATPLSAQPMVALQVMPEVMTTALAETDRGAVSDDAVDHVLKFAEKVEVIAIGPGLSAEDERTRNFVRAVIEKRTTSIVVDADGLNCLSPWPSGLQGSAEAALILTPHPGEMLRLLGVTDKSALDDRVETARDFAVSHAVILVLKGSRTIIAAPDGRVAINPTGNPGLGTAGSGDTLTGVICGFLSQANGQFKKNMDTFQTVVAAVYISGLAGDLAAQQLGMRAMVASDIRDHLGDAFHLLDPFGEAPALSTDII
jgi:ADP-dependent NAD(P)H-hydrate dehydratase / NAD(P)H-hydrate epimerase